MSIAKCIVVGVLLSVITFSILVFFYADADIDRDQIELSRIDKIRRAKK